jgi:hypothetical protein
LPVLGLLCSLALVCNLSALLAPARAAEVAPEVAWSAQFGGAGIDGANAVRLTADGGFVLAGYTFSALSHGGSDAYLVKTDADGVAVWQQAIGGAGDEAAYCVEPTDDGGYILSGYTRTFAAGGRDAYLVKTDAAGSPAWQAVFGAQGDEEAFAVRPTADGGYVAAGYATSYSAFGDSDAMLLKTDSQGSLAWLHTYGTLGDEKARDVRPTADGGYILVGSTTPVAGASQVYLVKTNADGLSEWRRTFAGDGMASGLAIRVTADGGLIIVGATQSAIAPQPSIYLLKTDATGNKVWDRSFAGVANDVIQTVDGGYVVTGALGYDAYLLKTDGAGTKLWGKTFRTDAFSAYGASLVQTADQGFAVGGYADPTGPDPRNAYLVKFLSPAGNGIAPPARVVASDGLFADHVAVSWSASPGAKYYQLSRASTFGGERVPITPWQTARAANDTSVTANTVYFYWVQAAADADGKKAGDYSLYDSGWAAPPDVPVCRITFKGCGVTVNPSGTIEVGDTLPAASVKIQRLKTRPANLTETFGIHYTSARSLGAVSVAGTLGTFYTEAPVASLAATGGLRLVTTRACTIADLEAAAFGTVLMSDTPNSTDPTSPTLSLTRIAANGQPLPVGYAKATVGLTGVSLDSLDLPLQSVAVRAASKHVLAAKGAVAFFSLADVRAVTAGPLLTLSVTGADVTGHVIAAGVVQSLTVRALRFDPITWLGGHIGPPADFPASVAERPILPSGYSVWIGAGNPAWRAAHPVGAHAHAPAYIGKVSAARGILAVFLSSTQADGTAAYVGSIGSLATPAPAPGGLLGLWGIADVSPDSVPLHLSGDTAAAADSRLLISTAP